MELRSLRAGALFFMALGAVACGDDAAVVFDDAGPLPDVQTNDTQTQPDMMMSMPDMTMSEDVPAGTVAPGRACNCDTECEGTATHEGLCVQGICMMRATEACASAGSSEECPDHLRCWNIDSTAICWPDSDFYMCDGDTDGDGSCVPNDASTCDDTCSELCGSGGGDGCPANSHMEGDGCVCDEGFVVNAERTACVLPCETDDMCDAGLVCIDNNCVPPPCTPGSCGAGSTCDVASGVCVIDIGVAPAGPPPTCAAGVGTVPDWRCTTDCAELVPFEPDMGPGYWDYPLNGETAANQYRSYIRRDVMMLVKYAAAMVECQAAAWDFANGGLLGLGDMSEADGAIPGTSIGSPGHPAGTHVNGHDMDIAYYQTGTADNRLRAVCEHTTGGVDQYHCTGAPTMLDPWRTANFIGHLHINPNLRVIGVDGQIGPVVESAVRQLCSNGYLSGGACSSLKLAYETTDMMRGWFRFHHHHLHISISG